MPIPQDQIAVGLCYESEGGQIRKVTECDEHRVWSAPWIGGGWGEAVAMPVSNFASEVVSEVQCPE